MYIYEWVIIISHKIGGRNGYKKWVAVAIVEGQVQIGYETRQYLNPSDANAVRYADGPQLLVLLL